MKLLFCVALSIGFLALDLRAAASDVAYLEAYKQYKDRKFEECQKTLEAAIKQTPDEARLHNLLGACFVEERDWNEAHKSFQRAHKLAPSPNTAFNIAEMSYVLHFWEDAMKQFGEVARMEKASAAAREAARFKVFVCALKLGRGEEADALEKEFAKAGNAQATVFCRVARKLQAGIAVKEEDVRALGGKKEGAAVFVDSLLEAYFLKKEEPGA